MRLNSHQRRLRHRLRAKSAVLRDILSPFSLQCACQQPKPPPRYSNTKQLVQCLRVKVSSKCVQLGLKPKPNLRTPSQSLRHIQIKPTKQPYWCNQFEMRVREGLVQPRQTEQYPQLSWDQKIEAIRKKVNEGRFPKGQFLRRGLDLEEDSRELGSAHMVDFLAETGGKSSQGKPSKGGEIIRTLKQLVLQNDELLV